MSCLRLVYWLSTNCFPVLFSICFAILLLLHTLCFCNPSHIKMFSSCRSFSFLVTFLILKIFNYICNKLVFTFLSIPSIRSHGERSSPLQRTSKTDPPSTHRQAFPCPSFGSPSCLARHAPADPVPWSAGTASSHDALPRQAEPHYSHSEALRPRPSRDPAGEGVQVHPASHALKSSVWSKRQKCQLNIKDLHKCCSFFQVTGSNRSSHCWTGEPSWFFSWWFTHQSYNRTQSSSPAELPETGSISTFFSQ